MDSPQVKTSAQVYPGFYRGIVKNNDDSETSHPYLGRVRVLIPQVYGEEIDENKLPWAWPCWLFGGGKPWVDDGDKTQGRMPIGAIFLPRVGDTVWCGFEQGDPGRPIWFGGWYGKKDDDPEMPELARSADGGTTYPDICLLKPSGRKDGMYIRWIDDKKMEIVFEKDETHLTFDDEEEQVTLETEDYDIEIKSANKSVNLEAGDSYIRLNGETNTLTIRAETIRVTASNATDDDGLIRLLSAGEINLSAVDKLQGSSPDTSGFDRI